MLYLSYPPSTIYGKYDTISCYTPSISFMLFAIWKHICLSEKICTSIGNNTIRQDCLLCWMEVRQGKVQYRMVGSKIGAGYKDKHRTRLWKAVMKRLYRKRQTTPRVILRRDKLVFFVLHSWKISFSCSSSNPYYLTKWLTHSPLTACDFKIFNLLVIKWNSLWFDCTIISCLC